MIIKMLLTFVIFLLVVVFVLMQPYGGFHAEIIRITMVNKLQECEEDNMNYTIVDVSNSDFSYLKTEIVMPHLEKKLNTVENNKLIFPAYTDKRLMFTVDGYYSKSENPNKSDGCVGAHIFKIVEIISVVDVTKKNNYPINNN